MLPVQIHFCTLFAIFLLRQIALGDLSHELLQYIATTTTFLFALFAARWVRKGLHIMLVLIIFVFVLWFSMIKVQSIWRLLLKHVLFHRNFPVCLFDLIFIWIFITERVLAIDCNTAWFRLAAACFLSNGVLLVQRVLYHELLLFHLHTRSSRAHS